MQYFEGGSLIPNKSPGRLTFADVTRKTPRNNGKKKRASPVIPKRPPVNPLPKAIGLGQKWLRIRRRSLTRSRGSRRDGFAPLAASRKCERLRIQAVAPREPRHSHGFAPSRDACGAPVRADGPPSDS